MSGKRRATPDTTATVRAAGNEPLLAYHHDAPAPDPVATIGTWQAEAITIRRRDDDQATLFEHVAEWLRRNRDAEVSSVEFGRWERGCEVTLFVWRRQAWASASPS